MTLSKKILLNIPSAMIHSVRTSSWIHKVQFLQQIPSFHSCRGKPLPLKWKKIYFCFVCKILLQNRMFYWYVHSDPAPDMSIMWCTLPLSSDSTVKETILNKGVCINYVALRSRTSVWVQKKILSPFSKRLSLKLQRLTSASIRYHSRFCEAQ